MRKLLIIFVFILSLNASEEEGYTLGEGIQIASSPIYIGGYFSLDYRELDGEQRYRIDDIAILSYGNYEKFSYVAELEFKEFYVQTHTSNFSMKTQDRTLYIERLYADYNINENYMFRIGKYNSPIGFWNLLPINVLTATTSKPESLRILFPTFTTGVFGSYTNYDFFEFQIDLILQNNDDLDEEYNNYKIDKHYALGFSYTQNDYTLKLNTGYFRNKNNRAVHNELYYLLLSLRYETDTYQILGEIGTQSSKDIVTTKYAGYLQGVYNFSQKHAGIIRVEAYEQTLRKNKSDEMIAFGYTYRPLYPIALKSEFQFHSQSNSNQVLLSLSVLF